MIDLVSKTRGSIGYASTASLVKANNWGKIAPVCLDGVAPMRRFILDGAYPFWSLEHAYINATVANPAQVALIHAFLDQHICTTSFQQEVEGTGFVSANALDPDGTAARDHRGENPPDKRTQQG